MLTGIGVAARQPGEGRGRIFWERPKEILMPVILWLLGVPLTIVLLLMLFGVL